jgi:pyrimidine-nucleoside phosphorylase
MNQPLGKTVGNAVEVKEAIEVLKGRGPDDVRQLSKKLVSKMLELADIPDEGMAEENLKNGKALEIFKKMIKLQGGNPDVIENYELLPAATFIAPLRTERDGIVQYVNAELVGKASLILGAGRKKTGDKIDHSSGITDLAKAGEEVSEGQPLALLHSNNRNALEESILLMESAFQIGDTLPEKTDLLIEEL